MYVIGRSRDRAAVLEEVEEAISFKLTGVGRGPRMGQGWAVSTNPCLHQPLSRPTTGHGGAALARAAAARARVAGTTTGTMTGTTGTTVTT